MKIKKTIMKDNLNIPENPLRRDIGIAGSSFLISKNPCWSKIKNYGYCKFYEYGNFIKSLNISKKNEVLIIILSLRDIYDHFKVNDKNLHLKIKNLILHLNKRLKRANQPTIFAFETFLEFSPIATSKSPPEIYQTIDKFKKNLYELSSNFPNFFILSLDYEF